MLFNLLCPRMYADEAGGGGAEPADNGSGGDEGVLSLRDELSAEIEIQEKGAESTDLSEAARKLAGARRGKVEKPTEKPADTGKVAETKTPDEQAKVEAEKKA